ncbi:MAG TPA: riboflavin synthase subunit alpha [Sedimenticola thiotaurini]|uniref:Riboflavin synthase n=1 Tax=Sedimenticola thiotaurini TaxID=1543721 RepID=A0A831RID8_9GAMM|nr:riboflavin synthase subunit alpha [Sedimenticola thiotaurini]
MFTGIVQGTAEVVEIEEREAFRSHVVRLPAGLLEGLRPGASVAHNGCCLTVTGIDGDRVRFDLMRETLRVTNLGDLRPGDRVNVERAARFGDEIGGHQMSGHILSTAEVTEVIDSPNNRRLWFQLPAELARYLFPKGYIGVDGISLTIGEVRGSRFDVNLIPETLARTNLGGRVPGDRVNIEIDPQTQAIVDTVERVLAARTA